MCQFAVVSEDLKTNNVWDNAGDLVVQNREGSFFFFLFLYFLIVHVFWGKIKGCTKPHYNTEWGWNWIPCWFGRHSLVSLLIAAICMKSKPSSASFIWEEWLIKPCSTQKSSKLLMGLLSKLSSQNAFIYCWNTPKIISWHFPKNQV